MTVKEILGVILTWSPVWCFPIQIAVSILSAREAVKGGIPVKTIVFLSIFLTVILLLLICWHFAG